MSSSEESKEDGKVETETTDNSGSDTKPRRTGLAAVFKPSRDKKRTKKNILKKIKKKIQRVVNQVKLHLLVLIQMNNLKMNNLIVKHLKYLQIIVILVQILILIHQKTI